MAITIIPPPPMFADFDFDAALEELNTNPIYQPPAHWLRQLPYLDEIVNCDNIKYINREMLKYPDAQCVQNVFGSAQFIIKWSNRNNSQLRYWKYDTNRDFYPSRIRQCHNNIPYGRVHWGVRQSKPTGRIDSKWSPLHDCSKAQLIEKVKYVGRTPKSTDSKRQLIRMLIHC
jgi:hypothetical protein